MRRNVASITELNLGNETAASTTSARTPRRSDGVPRFSSDTEIVDGVMHIHNSRGGILRLRVSHGIASRQL